VWVCLHLDSNFLIKVAFDPDTWIAGNCHTKNQLDLFKPGIPKQII